MKKPSANQSGDDYTQRYRRPAMDAVLEKYGEQVTGIHDACDSVPTIGRRDFDSMVDSIKRRGGLLQPILVNEDGLLLDGRCRLSAMYVLEMDLRETDVVVSDLDPEAIAEGNLARRHFSEGQKLMMAAKQVGVVQVEAAERKRAGGEKGRQNRKNLLVPKTGTSQLKPARNPSSVRQVAKEHEVSRDKLNLARKIMRQDPVMAKKLEEGEADWEDAIELTGLSEKKRTPNKRKSTKETESNAMTPAELLELKKWTKTLAEPSARFSLAKQIRTYIKACMKHGSLSEGAEYPTPLRLANFCGCSESQIAKISSVRNPALGLESFAVIAALACIVPMHPIETIQEERRRRLAIAKEWFDGQPRKRSVLLAKLTKPSDEMTL